MTLFYIFHTFFFLFKCSDEKPKQWVLTFYGLQTARHVRKGMKYNKDRQTVTTEIAQ